MKFASVRVVTQHIEGLVEFYQKLSGLEAARPADGFAEIQFEGAVLAISSEHLIKHFQCRRRHCGRESVGDPRV
ncbi:MAG: hypothetical protein OSB38_15805 [Paraburkholderia fungorum]|nr:hypothetical protein [Paraburkholderia fungorum]